MLKTLIVYYSLTGNTRQIAEAIVTELDADLEIIEDTFNRDVGLGRFRSALEGLFGLRSGIAPVKHNPGEYDLVVVGTPIWAARLSSPVRAYLTQQRDSLNQVAFFSTHGGVGGGFALNSMAKITRQTPIARMVIAERQLDTPIAQEKIAAFVAQLETS